MYYTQWRSYGVLLGRLQEWLRFNFGCECHYISVNNTNSPIAEFPKSIWPYNNNFFLIIFFLGETILFSQWKSHLGWLVGLYSPIPWLRYDLSTLNLTYTKGLRAILIRKPAWDVQEICRTISLGHNISSDFIDYSVNLL